MNVYPGIYEAKDGNIYLYQNKDNYFSYQMECWKKSDLADAHPDDKNITADYLRNTYGKVESKEHAEFIVKLVEGAGGLFCGDVYENGCYFCIYKSKTALALSFYPNEEIASNDREKLITLPLPPKEENVNKPTIKVTLDGQTVYESEDLTLELITKEDFYFNPALKSLQVGGFKIIGKDEIAHEQHINQCALHAEKTRKELWHDYISRNKEWPAVGDEVSFPSGFGVVAIAKPDSSGVIIVESKNADSKGEYKRVALSAITKPTHEDILRNELQNTLADSCDVIGAVNLLMQKYDIKKKPE